MDINQQKTLKFQSLNQWMKSGIILGITMSALLFMFSISMICVLSIAINGFNKSSDMLVFVIFTFLLVVFLLILIGTSTTILFTILYLFDKQENTMIIAILNLIFAFGFPGYLILHGDKIAKLPIEEV